MDATASRQVLIELQDIIKRLAAPAPEQVGYLTQLGVAPSVDELALELDDIKGLVPQLVDQGCLTQQQAETVYALDRKLSSMSGQTVMWTPEALKEQPDWVEVRRLATLSLHEMAGRF